MSSWECGVCGYIQKEGDAPEKCPICEAPKKMFTERAADMKESEGKVDSDSSEVKKFRCTVCGYIHTGTEPPEKCLVCDAPASMFEEVMEEESEEAEHGDPKEKKWYCTVCGYIHTGVEPPEKCPVCGAAKSFFVELGPDGKPIGDPDIAEPEDGEIVPKKQSGKQPAHEKKSFSFSGMLASLVLKFHLHPITVHFPNGILPAVVVFLGIGFYFKIAVLETVAYYNLIFALVSLPVVIFTGYLEWQKRYKGIKTAVFITKIFCAVVVLCCVNVLVFWRLLDPTVFAEGSPYQLIYLGIAGVMVGAAGISGHLGGKLVFASRE